jgi:SAM-dependent MidA family methyltransferase
VSPQNEVVLADKLRARIQTDGPIPFEEYMAACLYDPDGGFFATGPLRSVKEGDFLTSPEVSPWFGRMLGRFAARYEPDLVVDVGAGSGSLVRPMMEALPRPEYHALEASPAAREALAGIVEHVHESFDELPKRFSGAVIANELVDNLPVALAVRSGDGWIERWVGATDDAFGLVTADARPEVVAWCDAYAGPVPEGGLVEAQLEAADWVRAVLDRLERGALVVIDYGGTAEELEPRRTQGTLRTYQRHHLGPDPLLEPGATDVTVDVNFTGLIFAAESAGAVVELHRQDDFLEDLGLRDVVRALRHQELELAKGSDAIARLKVRSEWTDADTLLHPRGLGDFRVMVAGKQRGADLPEGPEV